jgi:hypothetical protein
METRRSITESCRPTAGRNQRHPRQLRREPEGTRHSPATAKWIAWARSYCARIEPLHQPPHMPADPDEFEPEDLRTPLGRWSPYGPDRW